VRVRPVTVYQEGKGTLWVRVRPVIVCKREVMAGTVRKGRRRRSL